MRPRSPRHEAGTVATLTVTVDEHIVPRNPRQPYRVWCSDETGRLCLTYFNGREDYLKKLLPPGERRVVSGKDRALPGRGADDAPRPCRAARGARIDPAGRAGLWPDRRPDPAAAAEGDRRRRRARAGAAGMAGRGLPARSRNGRAGRRRSRRRMRRPTKPTSRRCIRRARASPSTSCWRASSRSRWCAITTARVAGRATKGDGAPAASARWRPCPSS